MIIEEQATLTANWLGALRSGEYEQGGGAMCSLDAAGQPQYCCLGVADKVCFGASFAPVENGSDLHRDDMGFYATLPSERAYILGLNVPVTQEEVDTANSMCPHLCLTCSYGGHSLARMRLLTILNDSGMPFEEIADFIEEHGWLA